MQKNLCLPRTHQEVIADVYKMLTKKAMKTFGLKSDFTVPEFLLRFQELHEVEVLNGNDKNKQFLVDQKMILQRLTMQNQHKKNGIFKIESPFGDKTCPYCNGFGEKTKFYKKQIDIPCKFCNNGTKPVPCKDCRDTPGIYFRPGSRVGIPCIKCGEIDPATGQKLVGMRIVTCSKCLGSGIYAKPIMESVINTSNICLHCNGAGYISDSKKIEASNPVIPVSLGQKIKKAVAEE